MSSPDPKQADREALIDALIVGGVERIVVGAAACVLQGAPTATQDLDIVHRRTEDNVDRLLRVLEELDARIRDPAGRLLRPTRQTLSGTGRLDLSTRLGPLGVLHDGRGYDELIERTDELTDEDSSIRVLDLPSLIEVKREAGRARDRIVLPIHRSVHCPPPGLLVLSVRMRPRSSRCRRAASSSGAHDERALACAVEGG